MSPSTIIRCRSCHATDSIASTDKYIGTCVGAVVIGKGGELEFDPAGYTEIHWDSCEQIGWECRSCYAGSGWSDGIDGDTLDAALLRLVEVVNP